MVELIVIMPQKIIAGVFVCTVVKATKTMVFK